MKEMMWSSHEVEAEVYSAADDEKQCARLSRAFFASAMCCIHSQ